MISELIGDWGKKENEISVNIAFTGDRWTFEKLGLDKLSTFVESTLTSRSNKSTVWIGLMGRSDIEEDLNRLKQVPRLIGLVGYEHDALCEVRMRHIIMSEEAFSECCLLIIRAVSPDSIGLNILKEGLGGNWGTSTTKGSYPSPSAQKMDKVDTYIPSKSDNVPKIEAMITAIKGSKEEHMKYAFRPLKNVLKKDMADTTSSSSSNRRQLDYKGDVFDDECKFRKMLENVSKHQFSAEEKMKWEWKPERVNRG